MDSLGGLLSALFLGVVLPYFEDVFGMPRHVLFCLSVIALIYSFYSFCCSYFEFKNLQLQLKVIVLANLLYCCLTAALVFYFYDRLTVFGLLYFGLELIVVIALVAFETTVYLKLPSEEKA